MVESVAPKTVRYVKLGEGGAWEEDCFARGILRMGFGSDVEQGFALCLAKDWDGFAAMWREYGRTPSVATRFANETRFFVEDDGSTLWITFSGQRLLWGMLDPGGHLTRTYDGDSTYRPLVGGWRDHDIHGTPLIKGNLAGDLVSLAAYRGTSCNVPRPDYVIRKVNGHRANEVEVAEVALAVMQEATLAVIRSLQPNDFELLVDLIFTQSGWRRVGILGRTQKTLDLDIILPSTGERAMVQVKSTTSSYELTQYISQLEPDGPHKRLFYAFHSGEAQTSDPRVSVLGPERIAAMTLDAGLMRWVMDKVG
ncbi:hypothetical protein ASE00_07395 [Sphingomonas sp. Root710]|uniref:hypothetical protein n=1 Tax=Sphingomonas sp. Root710 TaxID=1736594 RepID=UPI000700F037|nr:hypothetical protein [Sphingomonas sp. Root710]KRB86516.1 hypothetical protein ASE00_07395 [Sphingomonas sp. Root710]